MIQANEEIVVSTEARMPHDEHQLVIEEAPSQQQQQQQQQQQVLLNYISFEAIYQYSVSIWINQQEIFSHSFLSSNDI